MDIEKKKLLDETIEEKIVDFIKNIKINPHI